MWFWKLHDLLNMVHFLSAAPPGIRPTAGLLKRSPLDRGSVMLMRCSHSHRCHLDCHQLVTDRDSTIERHSGFQLTKQRPLGIRESSRRDATDATCAGYATYGRSHADSLVGDSSLTYAAYATYAGYAGYATYTTYSGSGRARLCLPSLRKAAVAVSRRCPPPAGEQSRRDPGSVDTELDPHCRSETLPDHFQRSSLVSPAGPPSFYLRCLPHLL